MNSDFYLATGYFWPWAPHGPDPVQLLDLAETLYRGMELPPSEGTPVGSTGWIIRPVSLNCIGVGAPRPTWYFGIEPPENSDDDLAFRIAESIASVATLLDGGTHGLDEVGLVKTQRKLIIRRVRWTNFAARSRALNKHWQNADFLRMQLGTGTVVPLHLCAELVRLIGPALNEPMEAALNYWRASASTARISPGDLREVLSLPTLAATSQAERITIERSIHDAFKSVESLIGEPPSDTRRLRAKMESVGVDPDLVVGWDPISQATMLDKVRDLHRTRDQRAAHARSTGKRPISFAELADLQEAARIFILLSLRFQESGARLSAD